jgi:hypothetical protein
MKKKIYTGINIQYPISRLIIDGTKTIETRTYPIPPAYVAKEMALVETPGKHGKFKARVIAIVTFSESFKYKDKNQFYADSHLHGIKKGSPWAWAKNAKWGWRIQAIKVIEPAVIVQKRLGILYTKNISI